MVAADVVAGLQSVAALAFAQKAVGARFRPGRIIREIWTWPHPSKSQQSDQDGRARGEQG